MNPEDTSAATQSEPEDDDWRDLRVGGPLHQLLTHWFEEPLNRVDARAAVDTALSAVWRRERYLKDTAATPEPSAKTVLKLRLAEQDNENLRVAAERATVMLDATAQALEDAEADRDAARAELSAVRDRLDRHRAALAELVRLKDGPRDAAYERDKPVAWTEARAALAEEES